MQSGTGNLPKMSKIEFFFYKSFFSIPKESRMQIFCQISLLSDSGTNRFPGAESTFLRIILENGQMSFLIRKLVNPELRFARKSHLAPRIDF